MIPTKNALVLSGGNVKGAYQAGAIRALFNHTFNDGSKFQPDGIFGVSVGAMNGGFLADRAGRAALAGQAPDWPAIADELVEFWTQNITSFKSIGKKRNTVKLVVNVLFNDFNGLTSMNGAAQLARQYILAQNIQASPIYFACGVTNMATGDYINADIETYGADLIDYIIASTREPVNMPLFWKDGVPLADGGVRNIAPLKPAIDHGAERLAVIALKPEKLTPKTAGKEFKNILKLLKRTLGTLTSEIMNNDLDEVRKINIACKHELSQGQQVLTSGKRIIQYVEIRPADAIPIDVLDFNSQDIHNLIQMGEREAQAQLAAGWLSGAD